VLQYDVLTNDYLSELVVALNEKAKDGWRVSQLVVVPRQVQAHYRGAVLKGDRVVAVAIWVALIQRVTFDEENAGA